MARQRTMANGSLSDTVENEIVALYRDTDTRVVEIKHTYDLTNGALYSILRRHDVPTRIKSAPRPSYKRDAPLDEHVIAALPASVPTPMPAEITDVASALDLAAAYPEATAAYRSRTLAVTTDGQDTVISTERVRSGKTYIWEVRFESAIRFEAETITDAIAEAQRLPMCRRVFGASLKSTI